MFKKYTSIALLLFSIISFSQTSISDYQYALVPSKFKFLNDKNKYRLNATLKIFFEQKGYKTFLDDENQPEDFVKNNCNKIYVDLEENNTIFSTKLTVVIKDCKNAILLTSEMGTSRQKELSLAYNEALLTALKSINKFSYQSKSSPVPNPDLVVKTNANNGITVYSEMQSVKNGFNFLNKETKAVLSLYKTSSPYSFIAKSNNKNGIVFQKGEDWYFEYYQEDQLVSEKIDLKF
jgi:hypothetical protein